MRLRGTLRCGSRTSSATCVLFSQPSYAKKMGMSASPNAERMSKPPWPGVAKGCCVRPPTRGASTTRPARISVTSAASLTKVATTLRRPPCRTPSTFTTASVSTSAMAATTWPSPESSTWNAARRSTDATAPKPTASALTFAALPIATPLQPFRNAGKGPYAALMKLYEPPERGNSVPISAYVIAPQSTNAPPKPHARSMSPGVGSCCATPRGPRKMPTPIMEPTTTLAAARSPRSRRSPAIGAPEPPRATRPLRPRQAPETHLSRIQLGCPMVFDGRALIPDVDPKGITIATYCSHTSLQIFHGAKKEGFRTLGITVGAPPRYYEAFPEGRPDEFLVLKDHNDLFNHADELRRKNFILVPHGSFVEYLGANKFLDLPLLTFGNRNVLPWESDRSRAKTWLDKAGL